MKQRQIDYFFQPDPISIGVCKFFRLNHDDVLKNCHCHRIVTARYLIRCFLVMAGRKPYDLEKDGYGSHSGSTQSRRTIQNWCDTDREFQRTFVKLKTVLERETGYRFNAQNMKIREQATR
jgi:hypothetical protein